MKKLWLVLTLCFAFARAGWTQSFEARLNRSTLPEGETFMLTLDLKDAQTNQTPDFSPLKKDFTIFSVANGFRTNIINGQSSSSRQWNLVLMPKKAGTLDIPSIKLDNFVTNPLKVSVGAVASEAEASDSTTNETPKYRLEATIDNSTPYVQQQIIYTLILYDSGGLQGGEPIFLTTSPDDWEIKNLGAPEVEPLPDAGRKITFRYALFPQKSGLLQTPPVRFEGYYLTRQKRSDPFAGLFNDDFFSAGFGLTDVFASRTPVVLGARPIDINVRPIPAQNNGNWWLPAEDVKLWAEFSPLQPKFETGEAVSRNIYLQATGVDDNQLPEIKFENVPDIKQYPEKPQISTHVENHKIIALEKIVDVYIPSKAGQVTLPEISVPWFNTKTRQMEKAVVPAMTVNVRNGKTVPTQTMPAASEPLIESAAPQTLPQPVIKPTVNLWLLLGGAFVAGALLCLLIVKLWSVVSSYAGKDAAKAVLRASAQKDLRAVRDYLLEWAAKRYPDRRILSLQDVDAAADDKAFRCELDKLTEALYAKDSKNWNNFLFAKVFQNINKQKKGRPAVDTPLPKLYQ